MAIRHEREPTYTRRDALRLGGVTVLGLATGCSASPDARSGDADAGDPGDGAAAGDPNLGDDAGDPVPGDPAGDPAGDPSVPVIGPLFFVHLSDVHIGGDQMAVPALTYALSTVLPLFPGSPVFVTGDLNETGDDLVDWQTYKDLIDGAGVSAESFIEIPGNHDSLLDGDLVNYLAYSLTGRAGRGLYGIHHVDAGGRRFRVIAINTASAGDPVRDGAGYLESGQVDELIAAFDADTTDCEATFILGHHPGHGALGLGLFNTDAHFNRLLNHTGAILYLCGHVHEPVLYWHNDSLMAQASTLGNPSSGSVGSDPGFNIVALDAGPVTKHVSLIDGPANPHVVWPVVLITSPASPADRVDLLLGGTNPWASPLARNSSQTVRAGVFSTAAIDSVTVRVDGGIETPMTDVGGYYQADVSLFSDADTCTIEVSALSGGVTGTDSIEVEFG